MDTNDPLDSRKELIKQYIPRVIAIILRYPIKTLSDSWPAKMHKLLHSIIHSCEEKNSRISKYKSTLIDESPTQIDIDLLISQLPDNSQKLMQKQSKEKVSLALQSLVSSQKSINSVNKNLLSSIYKDSKQFKYFASQTSTSYSSYLDSVPVDNKRKSILLENISSIERLNSGQWEENSLERKSSRIRTAIDKRLRNTRNHKSIIREFPNIKESISEEPEKIKSQDISEEEEQEEVKEDQVEEEKLNRDIEIAIKLEELAKVKKEQDEIELRPKFVRQNTRINEIVGRKRPSKLWIHPN
jgi:hypothetical protein